MQMKRHSKNMEKVAADIFAACRRLTGRTFQLIVPAVHIKQRSSEGDHCLLNVLE